MQAGVPSSLLPLPSTELWSRRKSKDLLDYKEKEEEGARCSCLLPPNTNTPGPVIPRYKCVWRRGEEGVLLCLGSEDVFKGNTEGQGMPASWEQLRIRTAGRLVVVGGIIPGLPPGPTRGAAVIHL